MPSRREMLKAAAIGTFGLAFLERFAGRAHGDTPAPKRLLVLCRPNGNSQGEGYYREPDGAVSLGPTSALSPLAPWRDRVSIVSGTTYENFGGEANFGTHLAWPYVLTVAPGAPVTDGGWDGGGDSRYRWSAGGMSLDRHLARSQSTPFPSVAMRSASRGLGNISYEGPPISMSPNPTPTLDEPEGVWRGLFEGLRGSGETPDDSALRAERRRRVLVTRTHRMLDAYRGRMAGWERETVEAHLAAIEQLGMRVRPGTTVAGCDAIPVPDDPAGPAALYDTMTGLVAEAFRCDLTRVVTMAWRGIGEDVGFDIPSNPTGPGEPIAGGGHDEHGDIGHYGGSDVHERYRAMDWWYSLRLVPLIERLEAMPEGDGTVLDNTILVVSNRDGNHRTHSYRDLTTVIVAGRNTGLVGGRSIRWGGGTPGTIGSHAPLLATLCTAMGVDPAPWAPGVAPIAPLLG